MNLQDFHNLEGDGWAHQYILDTLFYGVDDIACFFSKLLVTIINYRAPLKTKFMKKRSVPYMNNGLRTSQYLRNMVRNKFKKIVMTTRKKIAVTATRLSP